MGVPEEGGNTGVGSDVLLKVITSYENPRLLCAGAKVIEEALFEELAVELVNVEPLLDLSSVITLFKEQAKRFTACGGNSPGSYGVLRKNPSSGWSYIINAIYD